MLPGRAEGDPASTTAPDPRLRDGGDAPWRAVRRLERGLFFAGLAALGLCAAILLEAGVYQAIESARLERARSRSGSGATPGDVVGRIEIPRLRMSVMIREGVDPHTLLIAAGHLPGTALPGEDGNMVLSAHRDSFFRPLRRIRSGDTITIVTPASTYTYRVEETSVTTPDRTEVLAHTSGRTLTLITCYPFNYVGPAPRRFIVRARPLESLQAAAG